MTAENEMGFIKMQLHEHGFYTNWLCHREAQSFLFKMSFTSLTHSRENTLWMMQFYT